MECVIWNERERKSYPFSFDVTSSKRLRTKKPLITPLEVPHFTCFEPMLVKKGPVSKKRLNSSRDYLQLYWYVSHLKNILPLIVFMKLISQIFKKAWQAVQSQPLSSLKIKNWMIFYYYYYLNEYNYYCYV